MKVVITISLTLTLVAVVHGSYYYESDESGPAAKRLFLDALLGLPHPGLISQAELQRQMFMLGRELSRPPPVQCGNSVKTGDTSATACGDVNFSEGAHGGSGGGSINWIKNQGSRKRYLFDIAGRQGQLAQARKSNNMQNQIMAKDKSYGGKIKINGGQSSIKRYLLDIASRQGQLAQARKGNNMQNRIVAKEKSHGGKTKIKINGGRKSTTRYILDVAGRHGELMQVANMIQNMIKTYVGSHGGAINLRGGQGSRERYVPVIAGRQGQLAQARTGNNMQNRIVAKGKSLGGKTKIKINGGRKSMTRYILDIAGRHGELMQVANMIQNMIKTYVGSHGGAINLGGGQGSKKRYLPDIAGRHGDLGQARQAITQNMILEQLLPPTSPPTKVECGNSAMTGDTSVNSCGNTNLLGGGEGGTGGGVIKIIKPARKRHLLDIAGRQIVQIVQAPKGNTMQNLIVGSDRSTGGKINVKVGQGLSKRYLHDIAGRHGQLAQARHSITQNMVLNQDFWPLNVACSISEVIGDVTVNSCGNLNFLQGVYGGSDGGVINIEQRAKKRFLLDLLDQQRRLQQAQQANLANQMLLAASLRPPKAQCGNSVKTGDTSATSCGGLNFSGGAEGGSGGGSINLLEQKKRTLITEALLIDRELARQQAEQDADNWHLFGLTQLK